MHKNNGFTRVALTFVVSLLTPLYAASVHSANALAISTGFGNHTCALTGAGGVKCWGANEAGQLGDNTFSQSTIPVGVVGLASAVAAVANGDEFTCALTRAGGVKCWGANLNGQLGNSAFPNGSPTPVDVDGLTAGVAAISAGEAHACALTKTGGVKCWGFNGGGQLGNGTSIDSYTPVDVIGLGSGVKAVAAGYDHTCALTTHGGIKCWGFNGFGQFGNGSTVDSPTPVDGGLTTGVSAIAVGTFHTCGLSASRVLKCWGLNQNGQLGSGSTAQFEVTPVEVARLGNEVLAVSGGGLHTCALTVDHAECWGSNAYGQLGDGTTADRFTPVVVEGLGDDDNHRISAGGAHTCAITEDGGAKCWGWNFNGQLGDNTTINSVRPVAVFGLSGDD